MSNETLGIILFFIIMFTWTLYIVQELFISGSSALNRIVSTSEEERKQVQVTTGLHFDGMEVWLIAALTITLAAFPRVFALTTSHLYIPFFLLLYALIARGVSIEVIYKLDNPKWVKSMVMAWTVSSVMIMFILGVYISNVFLGFPYVSGEMVNSFASIFNVTGISGGVFFVALSLVAGAGWLSLTTEGELSNRALAFVKKFGVVYTIPILLILVLMGLNNELSSIFIGKLYADYPILFVVPGLLVLSALGTTWVSFKQKGTLSFVFSLTTMGLFMITGYLGLFPNALLSRGNLSESLQIVDVMARAESLRIIIIAVLIFFPIIIGYQTWKYIKFSKKIKLNDE